MSDKRQRWIDAIAEHASYHRHGTGDAEGITTHSIADCPDLAPLLAEAEAAEQRADRLAAALLPLGCEYDGVWHLSACDAGSMGEPALCYPGCANARAALADSPKEENDGAHSA